MRPDRRAFSWLLAMQVPADMADWLDLVAVGSLLAYEWQAPPVAFAWLAVAMALPPLTLGLPLGVWVDRWPLRRTLLLANLGRGVATLALVLAPSWPALMVVVAFRAAADSAFGPAKQAALQALVPSDGLVRANGMSQAVNQVTKVAAPALGARLLLLLSPREVFLVNGGFSGLDALLALGLPTTRSAACEGGPTFLADGLREALGLLRGSSALRGAILLVATATFGTFACDTQIAPWLQALGQREEVLGLYVAAVGAGGLLGSALLITAGLRLSPLSVVGAASLASGLILGAEGAAERLGGVPRLPPLLALCVALGAASAAGQGALRAAVQAATPPGLMGRVAALVEAAAVSTLLVAPFCGAALAARFGIGAAFMLGGSVTLLVALGALHLSWRAPAVECP